jgi:3-phenylpropionate/trans-cinnamate dioxygenase ferredoxin component
VPEWVRVASTSDCPGDGCLHATAADGKQVVVIRTGGEYFAMEDKCSHQDFPLSDGEVENGTIECIFHGARFDIRTGKALSLPAIKPVKTYPVEIRDGEVYVQVG